MIAIELLSMILAGLIGAMVGLALWMLLRSAARALRRWR
jgi:hypothetical protein